MQRKLKDAAVACALAAMRRAGSSRRCGRCAGAQQVLVAGPTRPVGAAGARREVEPLGETSTTQGIRQARPERRQGGHQAGPDDVAGLVAADYGNYGPFFIRMLAQCRHLPQIDGRGGSDGASCRSTRSQLAGQRQPRQAKRLLCRSAEVRQEPVVGRLMVLTGNGVARVDGLQDLRLRRRPRRRLGARLGLLGARAEVPRAERYSGDRSCRSRSRRADGPHLREPRGSERQSDPLAAARTSARRSAAWR